MEIAIRSECDSRALLYPLIKTLNIYGTIAVYSSNKYLTRLIDNDMEGGFRNIRIAVNTESDLDALRSDDEYFKDKYDFVIYDNVGATDYDILLCMVTGRLSESYVGDLVYAIPDSKTHILKFGNPAPALKVEKAKKKPNKKEDTDNSEPTESTYEPDKNVTETDTEGDFSYNKWDIKKTDEELLQDALSEKSIPWIKFPTFDEIELMESRRILPTPNDTLIKELYRLFGTALSVDELQFKKGAKLKDEGSSIIGGSDVR